MLTFGIGGTKPESTLLRDELQVIIGTNWNVVPYPKGAELGAEERTA